MSRLIVKNLPKTITEEKIRSIFSQKGEITDIQLKYTQAGKFRQFCFIGFKTEIQAEDALNFFNKSCINTSILKVEKCANLGDSTKPKSWSKYAPDSSAYKKQHPDEKEESKIERIVKKPKESKIRQMLEKYKNDPMFEDFLNVHGAGDINTILKKMKLTKDEENVKEDAENADDGGENERDSGNESTQSDEEKVANKKISDLEYMKLLMKRNAGNKVEKQPKEKIQLYTVKLKGLSYSCKKKSIKEFFDPLKPYTIRIPPKVKGFAYVGFKTKKEMKQALLKDKSFIAGKRIAVHEYKSVEEKNETATNTDSKHPKWISQEEALKNEEDVAESGRIFLRNLPYSAVEDDVEKLFSQYGPITEVNLPIDKITRKPKGFGIVTFLMPEHAVKAYTDLDGSIFQGRMLHLLPGKSKDSMDDLLNTENLNYKQKKALKDKKNAGSSHNWNTLFIGQNAIADVIAETYATSKEVVVDGRGEGSAAVRLALGETQLVADIKQFFQDNDIHVEAFNQPAKNRSKTIFLVKNLPARTSADEIRSLFEKFGELGRVLLLPSGIIGFVEFIEPSEARQAFKKLAYTKFKDVPLYLEWAPENTFKTSYQGAPKTEESSTSKKEEENSRENEEDDAQAEKKSKKKKKEKEEISSQIENDEIDEENTSKKKKKKDKSKGDKNKTEKDENKIKENKDITEKNNKKKIEKAKTNPDENIVEEKMETKDVNDEEEELETDATLFVKNLSFATTESSLREHFQQCGKVHYAMIATKKDPKRPGEKLSMGYGFVRYLYKKDANKALKNLQQSSLDGKSLELKRSERTLQNEVKSIKKTVKHLKQTGSKILVRNVPFQANAKEIEELFKVFGEIKSLRLPRKLTLDSGQHRGFCFVEYVTKSDAKRAFEALSQSTHLYGRRLVLEWAKAEEDVDHLRKRTAEHFHITEEPRSKKSVMDVDSIIGSGYEFV